jgi:hypothetical protein
LVTRGMQGMTACEANTRDAMANRLGLKRVGTPSAPPSRLVARTGPSAAREDLGKSPREAAWN